MAHGRVKKQQLNNMFLKLRFIELTDGEMQIFKGMATWCSRFVGNHYLKRDNLLMCRLKVLLVGGYLANIGNGWADRYTVN